MARAAQIAQIIIGVVILVLGALAYWSISRAPKWISQSWAFIAHRADKRRGTSEKYRPNRKVHIFQAQSGRERKGAKRIAGRFDRSQSRYPLVEKLQLGGVLA